MNSLDLAPWVSKSASLATDQVSTGPTATTYDLYPPLVTGCPIDSTESVDYPLHLTYDQDRLPDRFYLQEPGPGLDRWQAMLPPLAPGLSLGEGGTALVADEVAASWAGYAGDVYFKVENGNPTGSHKDRLNICTTSAAVATGAGGVLVASSGNHAISASAYAARAGIACIALVSERLPAAGAHWLVAYGAAAVRVHSDLKWSLLRRLQEATGFQPVSNLTSTHIGHPFGPEGYKTIAYEITAQLGRSAPGSVFIPTGFGEMLFGVYQGFRELLDAEAIDSVPQLYSCEPAARGPLARAIAANRPAVHVEPDPTDARGISCRVNSYRGVIAVTGSRGRPCLVTDEEMHEAAGVLAGRGFWQEPSCGVGLAALRREAAADEITGPVVCILASHGVKLVTGDSPEIPGPVSEWAELVDALHNRYGIGL